MFKRVELGSMLRGAVRGEGRGMRLGGEGNVVYVGVVRGGVKLCAGRGVGRGGEGWRGVRWEGVAGRGRVGGIG